MSAAEDCSSGNEALLLMALDCAVPLRIHQISHWPIERILDPRECQRLADVVAEHGDIMLYRSKRKGETAKAFNELAQALARLAYMPGGVEFNGRVYRADHAELKPRPLAKTTWPGPTSEADSRAKRRRDR